jgi:lysozyme
MQLSQTGLAFIASFEGFSPKVYICPAGIPTIGYGHVVLVGEIFPQAGISKHQALELLRMDVEKAERAVRRLIKIPLNQNQFDALVSFTFNVGAGALQRSTLRMKINNKEFQQVDEQWRKWCRAGGKPLKGLKIRREAEILLFFA